MGQGMERMDPVRQTLVEEGAGPFELRHILLKMSLSDGFRVLATDDDSA